MFSWRNKKNTLLLSGVCQHVFYITYNTLWANSADDNLIIFFLFFPRKQDLTIHAIVSIGDMKLKNNLQKILPRVLSDKYYK